MSMEYTTARAIEHLTRRLHLPVRGDEQDWEIELADDDRLEEFLALYPEVMGDDGFAFALVALIIASFDMKLCSRLNALEGQYYELMQDAGNDVALMYTPEERRLWEPIAFILWSDTRLFGPLIRYWADEEEDDSAFACTLLFRNENF